MSVQEALQVAGIISSVMAVFLAVLTFYSFVSQDIPAVLDDLSGKQRMRELEAIGADRPEPHSVVVLGRTALQADIVTEVLDEDVAQGSHDEPRCIGFEVCVRTVLCACNDLASLEDDLG